MRVFVIGNAAVDETLNVDDFPAPGVSIFGRVLSRDVGGKGLNQAVALARTGLGCTLSAAIGDDARGREIEEALSGEPLETAFNRVPGVATDASTILVSRGGENAVITTTDAARAFAPDAAVAVLGAAGRGDLLVMQGNLVAETTAAALREARRIGMRTAINPSPLQPYFSGLWALADTVFLNEGEAAALGGPDGILSAGAGRIVLTLGARGARLIGSETVEVTAVRATVVDPTGAGDCFMGVALGSAAARGVELDATALSHAATAAAITVGRSGTVSAFPTRGEMAGILDGA